MNAETPCTYNGILLSLKEEGNSNSRYRMMNSESIVLSEIARHKRTNRNRAW
jgi:hypothetical protein